MPVKLNKAPSVLRTLGKLPSDMILDSTRTSKLKLTNSRRASNNRFRFVKQPPKNSQEDLFSKSSAIRI